MKFTNFNRFNKNVLAFAMLSVAALSSCTKDDMNPMSNEQASNNPSGESITTLSDRYIVVLKSDKDIVQNDAKLNDIQKLLQDKNVAKISVEESNTFHGGVNGFVATMSPEQAEAMKNSPDVEYIEKDQAITIGRKVSGTTSGSGSTTTTDPGYTPPTDVTYSTAVTTDYRDPDTEFIPWGITRMGAKGSSGAGKTAWIIDSGIDINHYELNVDQTRSKSFLSSTDGGLYSSPTDEFGHGTAVAGIIGARDNGRGIIGMAPDAKLVSLRVVNKAGSVLVSNIIRALDHVYLNGQPGDVVNISLQANASSTLDDAVKRVAARGIYVTIGSGNSAADCSTKSPQRVNAPNVYTVSAMNNDNTFWMYSNYGPSVDFTAPGTKIMTTEVGGTCNYASGTSFAAPHLAGLLLINNGVINKDGYVRNDPDTRIDPVAHK